jgi:hypothetical protein
MSHLKTLTNRITAYNSTLSIGGVPSPLDSLVVAESSVLRKKTFVVKSPPIDNLQNVVCYFKKRLFQD